MELNFEKGGGFITAVAVCVYTKEVLMVASMNRESWKETLRSGYATYFSRSRNQLWKKGETSGHTQCVKEIRVDCDLDSVVLFVDQHGFACHVGFRSCFFRSLDRKGVRQGVVVPEALLKMDDLSEQMHQNSLSDNIL
ncbi:TPA: phosphoribosyl-AMP cyclohydrolase [Candidatus Peribacteria bacterium]|nr:phosphoribosyl-AMP cyclohydrolase [Candidatus Peribacteria bacterium]